jgi:hypothetical protein
MNMKRCSDTSSLKKLLVSIDALDDERLFANGLRLVAVDLAYQWLALENAVIDGEHDSYQEGCPDLILHEFTLSLVRKRVSPSISRRWKEWLKVLDCESWCSFLSAACELVHGPYSDVFEIASRYPERISMCFRRNPDDSIVFEGGYQEIWVTDPQVFAHVFLETVVRDICNGISPLPRIDLPVTLADEFLGRFFNDHGFGTKRLSEAFAVLRKEVFSAARMELSDLSGRARIELAKRGWPENDHPAPEAITSPPPETDSGPRADLSGTTQQIYGTFLCRLIRRTSFEYHIWLASLTSKRHCGCSRRSFRPPKYNP